MTTLRPRVASILLAALLGLGARSARAADVDLVPGPDGRLGAWLVTDRFQPRVAKPARGWTSAAELLPGAREAELAGRDGARLDPAARGSATWRVAAGPSDLAVPGAVRIADARFGAQSDSFAYAYGEIVLEHPLDGALLVAANDGVRVWVDGRKLLDVDGTRPLREDEHVVPLRLDPGSHRVLLRLHRLRAEQTLAVRLVDGALAAPAGALLRLPGGAATDPGAVGASLAWARAEAGVAPDGIHPRVVVRFPGGVPRGASRTARAEVRAKGAPAPLAAQDLGEVPAGADGAGELAAELRAIPGAELDDARDLELRVEVAGRVFATTVRPRRAVREALAAAERAQALCDGAAAPPLDDPAVVRATLEHLAERVRGFVDRGDPDVAAIDAEAATLRAYADDLEHGRDPLRSHAGIRRFAYRSPLDQGLSPFGVYVPPSYRPGSTRKYPLVVALHGMNGRPLAFLRWFFGADDRRSQEWQDRHPGEVPPIEAFVVAPNAFGNAMYRELGEVDVMAVLDWASRFFPIDPRRVTITGASMGGTGAAWIPLRHPDRFAAAAPLCGYHSYLIRRDLPLASMRPWERRLAEHRSNVLWAENAVDLPTFLWHGTRDLPVANSEVLFRRLDELGYTVRIERPEMGHDVWRKAYQDLDLWKWLGAQRAPERRTHLVFRTDDLRWREDAWLAIDAIGALAAPGGAGEHGFGQVEATLEGQRDVRLRTERVEGLRIDRAKARLDEESVTVVADGQKLVFAAGEPIALHREGERWASGPVPRDGSSKRPGLAGPIRDVFHEPLTFVVGTDDPAQTRANEEVARHWSRVRAGVEVAYPIVRDVDLDDATAASRSLVLIGDARSNLVLRALEPRLPFRVEGGAVVAKDGRRWSGPESGVAFVHPNPAHPGRYVLVLEGTSPLGTLRATSLPDLLPDFVVYDARIAPARGSVAFGAASPLAAGLFGADWSLPPG